MRRALRDLILVSLLIVYVIIMMTNQMNRNSHAPRYIRKPSVPDTHYFTDIWLELSWGGFCIGLDAKNHLVQENCLPASEDQAFALTADGTLQQGTKTVCREKRHDGEIILVAHSNCSDPVQFGVGIWTNPKTIAPEEIPLTQFILDPEDPYYPFYLIVKNNPPGDTKVSCFSPLKSDAYNLPKEAAISLLQCEREERSVFLLPREHIQWERRGLMFPPSANKSCDYVSCGFNDAVPAPVALLPPSQQQHCANLTNCLTLIVKTARRPYLVVRLLHSVRQVLGYDLPTVVYDDGPEGYGEEVLELLYEFPLLDYYVGDREEGAARGRNLAVKNVYTKYFLVADDDFVFTEATAAVLRSMVDIMDVTDAAVVGGRASFDWSGKFEFQRVGKDRVLLHTRGSCTEPIVKFADCFGCEITDVFFVARTQDYLEVGGWSEAFKAMEHEDLFLKLRAAGKKVVYCPKFTVQHSPAMKNPAEFHIDEAAYRELRQYRARRMRIMLEHHWNIDTMRHVHVKDHVQKV